MSNFRDLLKKCRCERPEFSCDRAEEHWETRHLDSCPHCSEEEQEGPLFDGEPAYSVLGGRFSWSEYSDWVLGVPGAKGPEFFDD